MIMFIVITDRLIGCLSIFTFNHWNRCLFQNSLCSY